MQHRQRQTMSRDMVPTTNDQRFAAQYTACHPHSCYHDLKCGHRVQVEYSTEHCGVNCLKPMRGKPFVCPDCLVADVRLEMTFEGLDLETTGNDVHVGNNDPSREEEIQIIANMELKKLLKEGRRMCKISPKFVDPKLQFFHQFLLEEGYDGIGEDADVMLSPQPRYARPATAKKKTAKVSKVWESREPEDEFTLEEFLQDWEGVARKIRLLQAERRQGRSVGDKAVDGLAEKLNETRVGLSVEDEATQAVRSAFARFGLNNGSR